MNFWTVLALLNAILAAAGEVTELGPGEIGNIDTPDVAFKIGGVRYDITAITVKRAL